MCGARGPTTVDRARGTSRGDPRAAGAARSPRPLRRTDQERRPIASRTPSNARAVARLELGSPDRRWPSAAVGGRRAARRIHTRDGGVGATRFAITNRSGRSAGAAPRPLPGHSRARRRRDAVPSARDSAHVRARPRRFRRRGGRGASLRRVLRRTSRPAMRDDLAMAQQGRE